MTIQFSDDRLQQKIANRSSLWRIMTCLITLILICQINFSIALAKDYADTLFDEKLLNAPDLTSQDPFARLGINRSDLPIVSPLSSTTAKVLYRPIIIFGRANAKNRIIVLWNSREESAAFIRGVIAPYLNVEALKARDRSIIFMQNLDPSPEARGPGFMLFCPDNPRAYRDMFLAYMADTSNKNDEQLSKIDSKFATNISIERSLRRSRINLSACLHESLALKRAVYAVSAISVLKIRDKIYESPPILIWQGNAIKASDTEGLERFRSAWK